MAQLSNLFGRGQRTAAAGAEAVYARAIDGEHVWLAVRGDGPLVLRGDDVDIPVDTTTDTAPGSPPDGRILLATVPVARALRGHPTRADADVVTLRLLAGARPAPVAWAVPRLDTGPALLAPTTTDGRWQLTVEDEGGHVVVRRTRLAPAHTVVAIEIAGDDVAITLADGVRLTAADLPQPEPGTTRAILHQGAPVVRRRNVLERPHASVGLPVLPDDARELRWLKDGRLAVHSRAVEVRTR